jgi:lipoate-protein ligase A
MKKGFFKRVLIDKDNNGIYNMAKDNAILEGDFEYPTLRIYGWKNVCLSLGSSQKISKDLKVKLKKYKIGLVQRKTGGFAVLHDKEITYSVFDPTGYLFSLGLSNSYLKIAKALIYALSLMKIKANFKTKEKKLPQTCLPPACPPLPVVPTMQTGLADADRYLRHRQGNFFCFSSTQVGEINVNGRKLVGSAQYRKGRKVMQHGSILLKKPKYLSKIFPTYNLISIYEILGKINKEKFVKDMLDGFKKIFGFSIIYNGLTKKEKEIITHNLGEPQMK